MTRLSSILLTIDVEDWFQVENFKQWIPYSSWSSYELRVERNIHRLLDLLDSVSFEPSALSFQHEAQRPPSDLPAEALAKAGAILKRRVPNASGLPPTVPKATFFVLGWIAERLPHLVRRIHSMGHEVASHGYGHELCSVSSPEELREDLLSSKKLLEDIIGHAVGGYRAPSFSISEETLRLIEENGYAYDSSYNSFGMHGRYGKLDLRRKVRKGIAVKVSENLFELPISNLNLLKCTVPWGGGGYFRLIPFPLFEVGVRSLLRREQAYLFYCHPWEIDVKQPKLKDVPAFYRFRHYVNMKKTQERLEKLLENFKDCRFITCRQYLDETKP